MLIPSWFIQIVCNSKQWLLPRQECTTATFEGRIIPRGTQVWEEPRGWRTLCVPEAARKRPSKAKLTENHPVKSVVQRSHLPLPCPLRPFLVDDSVSLRAKGCEFVCVCVWEEQRTGSHSTSQQTPLTPRFIQNRFIWQTWMGCVCA